MEPGDITAYFRTVATRGAVSAWNGKTNLKTDQKNMTSEQAYIEGFVKRASEYGYSKSEAVDLYKEATRWRDEMLKGNILVYPSTSGGYGGASFGDHHIGENTFNPPKDYTRSLNYLEDDIKGLPSSSKNNWDIS